MKKCPLEKRGLKSLAEEAAVAAAAEEDDDEYDPQAAIVVSIVKAHSQSPFFGSEAAFRQRQNLGFEIFYASSFRWEPGPLKIYPVLF